MKNKLIIGISALLVGVAVGWFAAPNRDIATVLDKSDSNQVLNKLIEAGEINDAEKRALVVKAAFSGVKVSETDALAAPVMKLATQRPDMTIREEFLQCWGKLAPQKALAYLGSDSLLSDRLLVLKAWASTDPAVAAESILPSEKKLSEKSLAEARAILDGIAEADPVKAIKFADHFALDDLTRLEFKWSFSVWHQSFSPSGSYQIAIDKWIRKDPEHAFEVMMTLKPTNVREQALNELFHGWPNENPNLSQAAAIRLWDMHTKSDSGTFIHSIELLETLTQNHGALNGRETYSRAIELENPEQRIAALKAALEGWKNWENDRLPEIADFIAMRINDEEKTNTEAEMLIHAAEWTTNQLTENGENNEGITNAFTWLEKLPSGKAQDAAIRGIVSSCSWSAEFKNALEIWALALPPSHQRNVALASFAENMSSESKAKALELAASVEDPTFRAKTLANIGARFIPKGKGGDKKFDVDEWRSKNPKLWKELQAAKKD